MTFRVKQIFPAQETINELIVTSSGFQFPLIALDPQLYLYTIQVSNNVKNVLVFAKLIDIYRVYSIV